MGKLKSVYSALLNRDEKIMKRKEIVKLIEDYKKIEKISIANALWYLSRQRYIKRIFLDYYYINSIEEREQKFYRYLDKELLFLVLNKIDLLSEEECKKLKDYFKKKRLNPILISAATKKNITFLLNHLFELLEKNTLHCACNIEP